MATHIAGAAPASAQTVPNLRTAANFAVLGGPGVACTGFDNLADADGRVFKNHKECDRFFKGPINHHHHKHHHDKHNHDGHDHHDKDDHDDGVDD